MSIVASTVGGTISLVKLPLDTVAGFLPDAASTTVKLTLNRADASLRGLAGSLLHDTELRQQATRLRAAADEREKALRLRAKAAQVSAQAGQRLDTRQAEVEKDKAQAEKAADDKRDAAKKQAEQRQSKIEDTERKQREAADKLAAAKAEQVESEARKARLEQLRDKDDALAEKEKALTVANEADRLQDAATATKTARKS